jgi:hypothetical protein
MALYTVAFVIIDRTKNQNHQLHCAVSLISNFTSIFESLMTYIYTKNSILLWVKLDENQNFQTIFTEILP